MNGWMVFPVRLSQFWWRSMVGRRFELITTTLSTLFCSSTTLATHCQIPLPPRFCVSSGMLLETLFGSSIDIPYLLSYPYLPFAPYRKTHLPILQPFIRPHHALVTSPLFNPHRNSSPQPSDLSNPTPSLTTRMESRKESRPFNSSTSNMPVKPGVFTMEG